MQSLRQLTLGQWLPIVALWCLHGCGAEAPSPGATDAGVPVSDSGLELVDAAVHPDVDAGVVAEDGGTNSGGATDGGATDGGARDGGDDVVPGASRVEAITFNWPARYGPSPGVDSQDRLLWGDLSSRASVMALQEAGWIAGYIRERGWRVYRPDPPGDDDPQPVGNFLVWDPDVWQEVDRGWYLLSPATRIQPEAAGPTLHRTKYVVWARLRHRRDDVAWTFGSVHFVPSKHLGGAALALWEQQRDSLLSWWARQDDWTLVMGDFNAQPEDRPCRPFWEVAQRQTAPSHGDREIDWIVRKPALTAAGVRALDHRGQSDHRPVHGVVRWIP